MLPVTLSGVFVGQERIKWPEKTPSFARAVLVLYLLSPDLIIRHFSLGAANRRDRLPWRTREFEYFHQISSRAHVWKSVNLDIGFDRSQKEPRFLHFPFSVILPHRLLKGGVLFFLHHCTAILMAASKTYSFSWQTAYFTSGDMCLFLELRLRAAFSGTSLTPHREFGLKPWLEMELTSLLFLLFSPFPVFSCLTSHTPRLCLACQGQAAVPPAIHIAFHFLPAGQDSSEPNPGHIWNSKNTAQNPASESKCLQINNSWQLWNYSEESYHAECPNWGDTLAATNRADLLEDAAQLKVWLSPAHTEVKIVHNAENRTWFCYCLRERWAWIGFRLQKEKRSLLKFVKAYLEMKDIMLHG